MRRWPRRRSSGAKPSCLPAKCRAAPNWPCLLTRLAISPVFFSESSCAHGHAIVLNGRPGSRGLPALEDTTLGWPYHMIALATMLLVVDGAIKLLKPPLVVKVNLQLGYEESAILGIGV